MAREELDNIMRVVMDGIIDEWRSELEQAFERLCTTGETGIRVFYTKEPPQLKIQFPEEV